MQIKEYILEYIIPILIFEIIIKFLFQIVTKAIFINCHLFF